MLRRVLAPSSALAAAACRAAAGGLTSSFLAATAAAAAHYSIKIVVPSLGDSISDGTIAAVLKRTGDPVAENETIAQIETDKVTIDIKAPSDGTILGVVVQEADTVVPGQLVATLDDAEAKAKLVGHAPPAAAAAADGVQQQQADTSVSAPPQPPAAAAAAAGGGHHARVPGISFPPRITADGRRVSALPAAEAAAILQQWRATQHSGAGSSSSSGGGTAAAAVQPSSDEAAFAAWAAAQAQRDAGASLTDVPSKFATSVTRLTDMPARRELSARDIELIELGGAAP